MTGFEEALDLAPVEAPVAAGRRERLDPAVVGPASQGVGVDTEQARGGAEGQAVGFDWDGDGSHGDDRKPQDHEIWVNLGAPWAAAAGEIEAAQLRVNRGLQQLEEALPAAISAPTGNSWA